MVNNKTPGSDGISVEFYKVFWDKINMYRYLIESYDYSFEHDLLIIEQRRALFVSYSSSYNNFFSCFCILYYDDN